MKVHQAEMWSLLRSEQTSFERRLAETMAEAILRKDELKVKAADAAPVAKRLFSVDRAVDHFLDLTRSL
jgi:hypothetical protein